MEWGETDLFEKGNKQPIQYQCNQDIKTIQHENERKIALQLLKLQDPSKDLDRQAYIMLVSTFGVLLSENKLEEIGNTLMTKDTEIFVFQNKFSNTDRKHAIGPAGLIDIFRDRKYINRQVLETYVDMERSTVGQICDCTIRIEENESAHHEISFEFFSIKDLKVAKYRRFFGAKLKSEEKCPFEATKKEKMLSKVKEINLALAGQPDLQKVASLLHESTEYKIWSWEGGKCVVLEKQGFETGFQNLQQKFVIRQIVPFEIFTDNNTEKDIVISTYSYHLEAKDTQTNNKFVWLANCIYAFDENINITKVIQQGELNPEGEISIPFEAFSRETLENKIKCFFKMLISNFDIFYNDLIQPDLKIYKIGPKGPGGMRDNRCGVNELAKLISDIPSKNIQWIKPIDIYFDQHSNNAYDVLFSIICGQGIPPIDTEPNFQQTINILSCIAVYFEKGKIAKVFQILSPLKELIPSPFDDFEFSAFNIKRA